MSSSDAVKVKTDELPVGSRLSHPINDSEDRLLLAAGVLLTERLKKRLIARGILDVLLHPDDAAALFGGGEAEPPPPSDKPKEKKEPAQKKRRLADQNDAAQQAIARIKLQASALASTVSLVVRNSDSPLSESQKKHGTEPHDAQQRERLNQHFAVTTQILEGIAQQAVLGRVSDDKPLQMVAEDYIEELLDDTDGAIASSREIAPDPEIIERGIRLALLGMAMAIEMGWDEHIVQEVGLCGLVHDIGMFRLEERLQDPQTKLTAADFQEITDHPLHTLDMLSSMKNISLPVRLAASQVHENPDGTGYPRRLTQESIHPYAALLHAADAYITLTANMHGRKAFLTYDVMVYLLNQVGAGRIDEPAMRALLKVISLFPIGSRVRLNDGTEAQVIRRNGSNYTAPIVQRVGMDRKFVPDAAHATIIDLAAAKMRVMTPLVPPDSEEERLEESSTNQVLWDGI